MNISTDFTTIPDNFAKAAPEENKINGVPVVSFPFYVDKLPDFVRYTSVRISVDSLGCGKCSSGSAYV